MQPLQRDLDRLSHVASSWNLKLNFKKRVVLRFDQRSRVHVNADFIYYTDRTALNFVQSVKDLGVVLECRLRFHEHVREIIRKTA